MLKKVYAITSFKALNDKTGEFEALVSVFGNVDYQGDRVMKGAFDGSIKKWQEASDPLPVIWSHDWQNPFAHIGFIDPDDMAETDEGLVVKGQIKVDESEFAAQVYTLLKERRVKEWSFGYDVLDEAPGRDRANELKELDIIETGPTLKGANSLTQTLGVKSKDDLEEAVKAQEVLDEAMQATREAAAGIALDRRPNTVENIEKAQEELADELVDIMAVLEKDDPAVEIEGVTTEAKAAEIMVKNVYAPIPGSDEALRDAVGSAVMEWHSAAYPNDTDNEMYNWASIVGTWPDHVVVEMNHTGEETSYVSIPYSFDADTGEVELGDAETVDIELTVVGTSEEPAEPAPSTAARESGTKSGRVLSAKSEGLVREIADAAGKLLASVEKDVAEDGGDGEKGRTKSSLSTEDNELLAKLALLEAPDDDE